MKPLNRPMFRYGGPIKEGIMSGIKEPRQNYNLGKRVFKFIPGSSYIKSSTKDIIPRILNKIKPTFRTQPGIVTGGTAGTRQKYISQTMPKVPFSQKAKAFVKENPFFTGVTAPFVASGAITATPTALDTAGKVAKATALQATDLLVPDFIFDQDKFLENKKIADLNQEIEQKNKSKNIDEKDKDTGATTK